MTSLRERIEAKQRRTAQLPILLGDTEEAHKQVATVRADLSIHQQQVLGKRDAARQAGVDYVPDPADEQREEQLRATLAEALERAQAMVAVVELQALEPDDWDALFGPIEPGEDGEYDLSQIHAVALAASCTDPDLQDEAWWKEQLARPIWSKGDRATISMTLLQLNVSGPPSPPGKG